MIRGPSPPSPSIKLNLIKICHKWRNWRLWGKGGGPLIINFYLNYYWWKYENIMFQISSNFTSTFVKVFHFSWLLSELYSLIANFLLLLNNQLPNYQAYYLDRVHSCWYFIFAFSWRKFVKTRLKLLP